MSAMSATPSVHAVVVAYLPDIEALRALLIALAPQVYCVQIIDNTPKADSRVPALLDELALGHVHLLRLGENFGIARALNEGAIAAIAAGATHLLLSDQDSLPRPDMVAGLLRAERELVAQGERVGAVGPTFTEAHSGITSTFIAEMPNRLFYGHARTSLARPLIEVLTLITSGTLIPSAAWATIGPMREDFFIDKVDFEWCHRARAAGFQLFGTAWATMEHHLGDGVLRVWYLGWHYVSAHSPLRLYYRVRNYIALCKLRYVPMRWKVLNAWYTLGIAYSHVIFGRERIRALHMALRGLWDGLRERMGRFSG